MVRTMIKNAIPDTVTVNGYTLADGLLTVDFGESYNVLNPQVEVLCRTAVVCTLNQIDGVDYVAFTIGGYHMDRQETTKQ